MFAVGEVEVSGLVGYANMLGAAGKDAPKVMTRALNRAGDMARTQVRRTLAKQTGLPLKTIRKAVKTRRASWNRLEYELTAAGGNISLKYFNIRETRAGVSAFLGEARGRELFEGTFFRGGRWPSRVAVPSFHGNVFERVGGKRLPIAMVKSDVFIAEDMANAVVSEKFRDIVEQVLPRRLDHELSRYLGV